MPGHSRKALYTKLLQPESFAYTHSYTHVLTFHMYMSAGVPEWELCGN